jgi:hypothetical protein
VSGNEYPGIGRRAFALAENISGPVRGDPLSKFTAKDPAHFIFLSRRAVRLTQFSKKLDALFSSRIVHFPALAKGELFSSF